MCLQDAYLAVQANPTAQDALGNLQRLVNTLLNTSNIATLCSLPFAADHTIQAGNGRQAPDLVQLRSGFHSAEVFILQGIPVCSAFCPSLLAQCM